MGNSCGCTSDTRPQLDSSTEQSLAYNDNNAIQTNQGDQQIVNNMKPIARAGNIRAALDNSFEDGSMVE